MARFLYFSRTLVYIPSITINIVVGECKTPFYSIGSRIMRLPSFLTLYHSDSIHSLGIFTAKEFPFLFTFLYTTPVTCSIYNFIALLILQVNGYNLLDQINFDFNGIAGY